MNNIICFLTVHPNELFYNFVKQLPNQQNIYICIDDNNYNIPNYDDKIKIIKIDNKICEDNGFKSTVIWKLDEACSRDKALYYFYKKDIEYDNIWFLEEDVFIPNIKTIENIDKKYDNEDLLVSSHDVIYEKREDWHWCLVNGQINLSLPYATSMICAIRCSKKLLKCVFDYAVKYKSLFLDEALFNTIALQNNLHINTIEELSGIVYQRDWKKNDIHPNKLYHPIKNMNEQYEFRKSAIMKIV